MIDQFYIGCCYYPEHWDRADMRRDLERIKDLGFNCVHEMLMPEAGETVGTYTDGFCKGKPAVVKNGNVYYVGFYSSASADLYSKIIEKYIPVKEPIDADLEEIPMGELRMYLNHSDREILLEGYDLLEKKTFHSIPAYGVILMREEK